MAVLSAYHWPGNLTEMFQLVSKLASTTETRS
jgi:two-component system response regulator HydG